MSPLQPFITRGAPVLLQVYHPKYEQKYEINHMIEILGPVNTKKKCPC
jgi:hypothetical protein